MHSGAPLITSCRGKAGNTWDYRPELACRVGLGFLLLAVERRGTHGITDLSWRVERRAADAKAGREAGQD